RQGITFADLFLETIQFFPHNTFICVIASCIIWKTADHADKATSRFRSLTFANCCRSRFVVA
ncbi:MAG TPA: hypothetical protein O0X61_04190, partial [Methanocorpusculum sp.]|nr:hypothetical protein [Methanocorpusculum sp.]